MHHYDACLQSKRWNLVRSVAAFQRRKPASLVATCHRGLCSAVRARGYRVTPICVASESAHGDLDLGKRGLGAGGEGFLEPGAIPLSRQLVKPLVEAASIRAGTALRADKRCLAGRQIAVR
jgi:hypothetical protein